MQLFFTISFYLKTKLSSFNLIHIFIIVHYAICAYTHTHTHTHTHTLEVHFKKIVTDRGT